MIRSKPQSTAGVWLLAGLFLAGGVAAGTEGVSARRAGQAGGTTAAPAPGPASGRATAPATGAAGQDRWPSPPNSAAGLLTGWEWWKDDTVKKEIGLTDDKAKRIDDIVRDRVRQLQPVGDEFLKERDELDRMTHERVADDASYGLQVWKVETLRSKLAESRTLMLYKIYKQLSPEQYKKLNEIIDRFRMGGGRGRSGGSR